MQKIDLTSKIKFNDFPLSNEIHIHTKSNYELGDTEIEDRLKKIYYIAVKTRNFEITQLVQRNNFFMIFQGVLIACIIYSNNTVPFIHSAICFIGIFISFFQMQISAGAKFWQEYWETEVNAAEKKLSDYYTNVKKTEFHKLFDKDIVDVQHTIYSRYFRRKKNRIFIKEKYDTHYFWSFSTLLTYYPFTKIDTRILTKPSVSKIPIRTARLLLISWFFLFLSSTFLGDIIFNKLNAHKFFTGFPGKSIASIDIRNYSTPDRNDGYDDDRQKCRPTLIPFKLTGCE